MTSWGNTGHKCTECKAEWNSTHSSDIMEQDLKCPNCNSGIILILNQAVPFSVTSGRPPDHDYYCICGKIFQYYPKADGISPFEMDVKKLRKVMEVKCPFCGRHNHYDGNWYVP